MEDADLDDISAKRISSCTRITGQNCYISTRIIAQASRYDEVMVMVTATIAAILSKSLRPATIFAPTANHSQ